jgi:hypothetical protein
VPVNQAAPVAPVNVVPHTGLGPLGFAQLASSANVAVGFEVKPVGSHSPPRA